MRVTRRVGLAEHELHTHEDLSSTPLLLGPC